MAADKRSEYLSKIIVTYVTVAWLPYCGSLCVFSLIFAIMSRDPVDIDKLYTPYLVLYVMISFHLKVCMIYFSVFYLHLLLLRLPWNQHTFMGWMAESTYITTGICAYFLSNNSLLAYFIASCLYHRAYCYTLKSLLNQLDDKTFTSRLKIKILLKDVIQLHSTAKDVFYQSADLFSIFILILLGGGMIFMACCMFQTDSV